MNSNNYPTTWRDKVRRKLMKRPRGLTFEMIANDLGVSVRWLSELTKGHAKNPGISTCEALNDYLDNYSDIS